MNFVEEADEYILKTYNRFEVSFEKGEGVYLYDVNGKKYLDFAAGIAVCALGYNNKEYTDTLKNQVEKLLHTSNYYYTQNLIDAAKKVCEVTKFSKVFFTNSGTEAVEGALKVAKKYSYMKDKTKEYEFIAMNHSFHGRSNGALAVTGNEKYQEGFVPKEFRAVFAEYNNLEDVKSKLSDKTCGIICEVVQGEGGIYPANKDFLQGLRDICDQRDIVLIFDEIQCGMGRCGSMCAHDLYGIKPDVMTLAKALGCGVPVGAFVVSEKFKNVLVPGDHGTTYGGNPFATAAVSKIFDLYEELNIIDNVNVVGKYLKDELSKLTKKYDFIKEVRGVGLMLGMELSIPVAPILKNGLSKGLVLINAGSNIIRFVPPLVITKENVDEMIKILSECLDEV